MWAAWRTELHQDKERGDNACTLTLAAYQLSLCLHSLPVLCVCDSRLSHYIAQHASPGLALCPWTSACASGGQLWAQAGFWSATFGSIFLGLSLFAAIML